MQSNVQSNISGYGSETEVQTAITTRAANPRTLTLRLRSQQQQQQQQQEPCVENQTEVQIETKKPSVRWTEETVNNENMGRKSSKRCCIYHKPKKFYESDSDESDSDEEKAAGDKESSSSSGTNKTKKKPVKSYQRHHA